MARALMYEPNTTSAPAIRKTPVEPPRFQSVKVSVLGRYMLADRREFPCQIIEMSPGGATFIAPAAGKPGERVIAYLDHIGRVEGSIVEQIDGGFKVELSSTARKRDKLSAQLTWLANKDVLDLPEDRRNERVVPDHRHSSIVLDDGRRYNCKIIDVSLSGAAIELEVRPAMGTQVKLGRMRAQITRHFENGVGVEFSSTQELLTVVQQNVRLN